MDDIKRRPPQRPVSGPSSPVPPPSANSAPAPVRSPLLSPRPIEPQVVRQAPKRRWLTRKAVIVTTSIIVGVLALVIAAGLWWYHSLLSPAQPNNNQLIMVTIEPGTTPDAIGQELVDKQIIRSVLAFSIYTRLHGVRDSLQAGSYRLSPAQSTPEIVTHLTKGLVDTFQITFYPGGTLVDTTDKAESSKTDVTSVLRRAGYSAEEIAAALAEKYDHPVFAGRPTSADLEGYVYGETYQFNSGASVETILERTFDELYNVIQANDLVNAYKQRDLTLFEGITLASIIQREVPTAADQKQVAQVFLRRLNQDMQLGSDVTYQYIADKTGQERSPDLDSPYNTRRYGGLPPGPIAAPGESSLIAVAQPAAGKYLYFLSGDDDVTYFARTFPEHQANILAHCQVKCNIP